MVKEGVICRLRELGVQFNNETIEFKPRLLELVKSKGSDLNKRVA